MDGRLNIGHDQSGGHPFAGDVGQADCISIVAGVDEIVVIARNYPCRHPPPGEIEAGNRRDQIRQQSLLDLQEQIALALHLPAKRADDHVDEDEHAEDRDVVPESDRRFRFGQRPDAVGDRPRHRREQSQNVRGALADEPRCRRDGNQIENRQRSDRPGHMVDDTDDENGDAGVGDKLPIWQRLDCADDRPQIHAAGLYGPFARSPLRCG
jgi:hypothetical protein